jgi:glutamate synthase (NADPH/NADH) large chain
MMLPEAWENHRDMDPARRAFYEYHANLMEPWDGPASLTFTDGTLIGAVLDRNGLRPGRYWVTEDGLVVLASESGVLDIDPATVVRRGRLEPGRMFLVDTGDGRIIEDDEVKGQLAAAKPYQQWIDQYKITLESLPEREHVEHSSASVERRQRAFGYTQEELKVILTPMANTGAEPLGAMGTDTPIAVLSARPRLLFDYFTQMFAQVTNPPLDAIREELVTSLGSAIGPEPNILNDVPEHARKVVLQFPVIDNDQLARITHIGRDERLEGIFRSHTVRGLYDVAGGGDALRKRLREIWAEVDAAIDDGATQIILSDRESNAHQAPIPSLLLCSAVHHHLLRQHTRTRISLVVEAGDVREVHHVALLIGYGAACVNPYLAMETVENLARSGYLAVDPATAVKNLIYALGKGVLKVMSKMGISTIMSYRGAQVFEAVGLSQAVIDMHFTGTTSRIGGVGLNVVAAEVAARHAEAYPTSGNPDPHRRLTTGGEYQWRREGEEHLLDPETIFRLQQATRKGSMEDFHKYSRRVDEQSRRLLTLRGLMRFAPDREPISIDQVEPVSEIVKRFSTGAMSFGSISQEAHETLARAMNSIGARSNTGEGGERPDRLYNPDIRSRVKQVASGRFGVTSEYLTQADDIQIKLAQGAKPGEGGQLPPAKVYPWVAEVRHSTPGVGLISPPPHHDIYSIEDLAQLIHDLKNANPAARIHVKLVSEFGVGTVAAGVSKAHADVVLISGHDGGTGASPLTSLKHAGTPWEIGLAETQQTLVLNNLRDRIVVQVDCQLRTGRDVVIGALLGAEEFGFAQAPMVVMGCVMMRVCHLDTCPTGVATQNPELRGRFTGDPQHVINFFTLIAQEVREHLAALGFATLDEAIGQVQVLDTRHAIDHWKAQGLDLAPVLERPVPVEGSQLRQVTTQNHGLDKALDNQLIAAAAPALVDNRDQAQPVTVSLPVRNVNRTVGTMLGHEVTKRYGAQGLEPGTIDVTLTGSAGQSAGAFLPRGITLRLVGDANDYVGKGLSGGRIVVRPDVASALDGEANVIAGNVIGYGATSGQIFLRGRVGERFGVRNSGATLVVEGVGDHACEYMTGGTVLVLGPTGRNVGAGMSGGTAYLLDLHKGAVNTAALTSKQLSVEPLTDSEWDTVRDLLNQHVAETESPLASTLLEDPAMTRARFSRIQPVGWARIRQEFARARQAGNAMTQDDWDQALWTEILEVAHG